MKRILLLLLFNFSVIAAFGQANGYFKSTHIINSDSTHGELNGTEYINSAGKWRYKEAGTWKYRASTADLAGSGVTNSAAANELMKSDGTNAVASGLFSTTAGSLNFGTGLTGASRTLQSDGSATDVSFNILSKGSGNILLDIGSTTGNIGLNSIDATAAVTVQGKTGLANALIVEQGDGANLFTVSGGLSTLAYPSVLTNTTPSIFRLSHTTSATPATGIGVGMEFETETASGNNEITGSIESVTTNVTPANEYADLAFKTMGEGTIGEVLRLSKLAGPTTRIVTQGKTLDIASTGWNFSGVLIGSAAVKIGIQESATIDRRLHTEEYNTATNTVLYPFRMSRVVQTGNGATGIGVGMEFEVENGSGANVVGSTIESVSTDATSGSEDFDIVFKNMAAGTAAAEKFRITSAGNATLVGTGTGVDWVATSDRRLKYHFKPVDSQLSKISAMSNLVTNYDRKDNGNNETGFVAQDLLKVAPEYVIAPLDTASGYYAVNYSKITPILIKGVDELSDEVTQLRQEVAELKAIVKVFRRITLEASAK